MSHRRRPRPPRADALDRAIGLHEAEAAGYYSAPGPPRWPAWDTGQPWCWAVGAWRSRSEALKALAWMDAQTWPWDREEAAALGQGPTIEVRRARAAATAARRLAWRLRLARWAADHPTALSAREELVADLWTQGVSLARTAAELDVEESTARTYRRRIRDKLPLALRTQGGMLA